MIVTPSRIEFGDFQTPQNLANQVCGLLKRRGVQPALVIEPTCGVGAFLKAALHVFSEKTEVCGYDINAEYVAEALKLCDDHASRLTVEEADFFSTSWERILNRSPDRVLVVGNPPWVTNAALGAIDGKNVPRKSNFDRQKGLDALTGKSNFDISEWMLRHLIDHLEGRNAALAMLCKTSVARKVLTYAWKQQQVDSADIYRIDSEQHFGVSVDACLFLCFFRQQKSPEHDSQTCKVFSGLHEASTQESFGFHHGRLVSNIAAYTELEEIAGESPYRWRSGVKHDCSKVMELKESAEGLINGNGRLVELEMEYLYPFKKSSEVSNGRRTSLSRWMLVTQKQVGEETHPIKENAPKTWEYLVEHADALDRRRSTIYRKRPRFSVFGVGGYAFAPWKVAISGFYKSLSFSVVGPHRGKPVVFDDTVYFLGCTSQEEATFIQELLSSEPVQRFLGSQIFWDAKRPITAELLNGIDLYRLSKMNDVFEQFRDYCESNPWTRKPAENGQKQFQLFEP